MRIFLSYASEDKALAEQVALALGGGGHEVFFDRSSLPAGGDFHSRILAAIAQAELFVFLAGAEAVRPGAYTLTELKFAREKWPHPKGHVLPVRLPGVDLGALPAYLTSVTVLEPEGNVAAEVLAAAQALKPAALAESRFVRGRLLAAGATALALGGVGWWSLRDEPPPLVAEPSPAPAPSSTPAPSVPPTSSPAPTPAPAPAKTAARPAPPAAVDTQPTPRHADALMRRLEAARIQADPGQRGMVVGWLALEDRRYWNIGEACLQVLDGRTLRAPVTIEVVVYKYARLLGHADEQGLPENPGIDRTRVARALVESFNEYNGASARQLDDIVQP